jgi:hypothetical protein
METLVELPKKTSAMLGEFQDSYHSKFTNFSTFMLDAQLVIDFEQHSKLHDSSPPLLDIQHVISLEQSIELPKSLPFIHDKERIRMNPIH